MRKVCLCLCACAAIPVCAALRTAEIQGRIDAAAAAGGGEVSIEAGEYEVGGLYLKSNVTLHLARGARLIASTNHLDYAGFPKYEHQRAVVSGISVTNAAIVGEGEIDGRGWATEQKDAAPNRWKDVIFYRAKDVRVEGVTLRNPASWTCYFKQCDGVTVRKVMIRSLVNHNNDGIDIEAKNVLVEDCDIEAEDDAICFKSDNPDFVVERCLVRRCRISSNCNFIKFGTSSRGIYRNVTVEDCQVACRSTYSGLDWRGKVPGVESPVTGISGIALEVVDGGVMENITVRNIEIGAGVQTPIFIRQGARRPPWRGRESLLKDILIENVRMTAPAASRIACSITGVPGLRPRNITIRSCSLVFPGGGTNADVERRFGEYEKRYPENRMFGKGVALPAYGFYVRHADGVRFENVDMTFAGGTEMRPALVKEDSTGVETVGCKFKQPTGEYPVVYDRP